MLLAIDPSIMSLGWAVFIPCADAHPHLVSFGTVKRETGGLPLEQRIDVIIEGLEEAITSLTFPISKCEAVIIEKPQLWGAFKSVASMHSGALLALHILVGALYWWGKTRFFKAHLVPVSEWKGQLSKEITQRRMEAKYSVKFKTDDESDAVGIGDHYITKGAKK